MTTTDPTPTPAYTVSAADHLATRIAVHRERAQQLAVGPAADGQRAAAQHLVDTLTPGYDLARRHPNTSDEVAAWISQTYAAVRTECYETAPAAGQQPAYVEAYTDWLADAVTDLMVADTLCREAMFDQPIPESLKSAEGVAFAGVINAYYDRGEFEVADHLISWQSEAAHAGNERFFADPAAGAQALHAARLAGRDHPTPPQSLAANERLSAVPAGEIRAGNYVIDRPDWVGPEL